MGSNTGQLHVPGIVGQRLSRRTFLEVVGLSALGLAGGRLALADVDPGIEASAGELAAVAPDAIEELAASLDYDVERIFRFVADELRYEPYPGILRGGRGALTSRAGNSADQSLLLASLLDASGVPVRFISGPIDDAQADTLLIGAAADAATHRDEAEAVLRGHSDPVPSKPAPDAELRASLDRIPEIIAAAREAGERQLVTSIDTITRALDAAGVSLPMAGSDVPKLERDQHIWVQVARGPEWIDLDPTVPDARSGETLTSASSEPMATLPDSLRHAVGFEVIAERVSNGALVQESIIDTGVWADELSGIPIALVHERPQALEAIGVALGGVLTGTSAYQAILQLGDRSLIGLSGLSFGGDGGLLGGLDAPATSSTDGEATAEWLDVHLTPPLGDRSTVRRTVFDRVGASARVNGAPDVAAIAPVQLVDLDDERRDEFLPLRALHVLAVTGGRTSGDVIAAADADESGIAFFERSAQIYQLGRDALSVDLALPRGAHVFLDGPNVTAFSLSATDASDAATSITASLDLLARSYGQLPVVGAPSDIPPALLAGVLSHVGEQLALGEGLPEDITAGVRSTSVGAILEAAVAEGMDILVMRDRVPDDLPYASDALIRLQASLADGWLAIAPQRPIDLGAGPRVGWWLVDPRTGRTLDQLDDGTAGDFVQYVGNLTKVAFRALGSFLKFGLCVAHLVHEAHLVFELATGQLAGAVYGFGLSILTHKLGHWACH